MPEERGAWATFGAGMVFGAGGWLLYWLTLEGRVDPPFPSIADASWLTGYGLDYLGLVLLLRARAVRSNPSAPLDGAVGVLALAALGAVILFEPVLADADAGTAALMTNLAYPICDLLVVATVVSVFALGGWRPGRMWGLIGASFALKVVVDSIYAVQSSTGTWEQGTLLNVSWPVASLGLALAAWVPSPGSPRVDPEGWRMLVVPAGFMLVALGVLVYGSLTGIPPVAALLAGAAVVAAGARSAFTFRQLRSVAERRDEALDAALTDHLTGLRNHRAFHEDLQAALDVARAGGVPVTLVMLDLVGLKSTNDSLGHRAGDIRLRDLAARIGGELRRGDVAYRVGGDEFAVVLPGVPAWDGFNLAERLQRSIAGGFESASPVVSVGVAEDSAGVGKDELIRRADVALIEAKRSHRKTVLHSPDLDAAVAGGVGAGRDTKTLATALARAVDAKDSYTRSHCETVAETCVMIAVELGLEPERTSRVRLAGLLHDVGKIGIPDTILQKSGLLTEDEFAVMKTHSELGHSILAGAGLEQEARWVLHHHERFDGGGYPAGLAGDDVPLESRIILVADTFEAMTSDRPYRGGQSLEIALEELRRLSGTQFDPACVEALEAALARGGARVA